MRDTNLEKSPTYSPFTDQSLFEKSDREPNYSNPDLKEERGRLDAIAIFEGICDSCLATSCTEDSFPEDKYVARFEIPFETDNGISIYKTGPWAFDSKQLASEIIHSWSGHTKRPVTSVDINVPEKDIA